jgi:hypothetical protein
MSKLYTTIKTDLVDPELEAKVDVDIKTEPIFVDIPNDLYAAISTNTPEANTSIEATSPEVRQFAYSVPNRLYQQIVPEKPSILAEERIFVYVPKASYDNAGIAKFAIEQFNIIDGRVTIKQSYLSQMLSSNLIKPEVILIVTELPTIGLDNRIYLVPVDSSTSTGYIWNSTTSSWTSLGTVSLNIDNYHTKAEIETLLNDLQTALTETQNSQNEALTTLISNAIANIDLSEYYTKTQVDNLLTELSEILSDIDLSDYYTKEQITILLADLSETLSNIDLSAYYTKAQVDALLTSYSLSANSQIVVFDSIAEADNTMINEAYAFIKSKTITI